MLEALLLKKKAIGGPWPSGEGTPIFNLDLTTGAVGTQVLYETVAGRNLTRGTFGSPGTADGYVDHPSFGRCYRFNGGVVFANPAVLALNSMNYLIECEVASTDATTNDFIFGTGDYPSSPHAGSAFSLNQFPSTYPMYFQTTSAGSFRRVMPTMTNDLSMQRYSIRKDASGVYVTNVTKGVTLGAAGFNTGGDTFTRVGATSANTGGFNGWMKNLRVSQLP